VNTFSKVINNVQFKYEIAEIREAVLPMETRNTLIENNFLLQVNKGKYWKGESWELMKEGSFYFVPKGHNMFFRMCEADRYDSFGWEGYGSNIIREKYSHRVDPFADHSSKKQLHSIVSFDALLYDSIPFFSILDLPAISIPHNEELTYLVRELVLEEAKSEIGKEVLLQSMTQQVLIRICRYLETQEQFAPNFERVRYLTDKRLVDVITFVKGNLEKDLSNSALASVSFLSEDYIGQFFKSLTGQNLQEYVERQRLEKARQLLITTPDSVQEIAFKTGFRDPAYFSRRFKMLFNKNAVDFRKP
jgi:AraC family transcriptional regulator of arabinose operon